MKRKIATVILAMVLSTSLFACSTTTDTSKSSSAGNGKRFVELQKKYDKLSEDYDELQQNYSDLQTRYNELEQQLEQYTSEEEENTVETPTDLSQYATDITYDQLARTPDDYFGKAIKITGEVIQLMEGTDTNAIRLAVDGSYDTIMYMEYNPSIIEQRILEDDTITVYGIYCGIYQYTSTMGATISVPSMAAQHIEINQ